MRLRKSPLLRHRLHPRPLLRQLRLRLRQRPLLRLLPHQHRLLKHRLLKCRRWMLHQHLLPNRHPLPQSQPSPHPLMLLPLRQWTLLLQLRKLLQKKRRAQV